MVSSWLPVRSLLRPPESRYHSYRIEEFVDDPLFERDDCVVGYRDALGAHLGATLSDVAVTDTVSLSKLCGSILSIERMHFQGCDIDQEARADELVVKVMIAEYMADVLAKVAFDALAKFLNAIDIRLCHSP